MWFFIILSVIIVIIVLIFTLSGNKREIDEKTTYDIKECVSEDDVQYQIDYETQKIIENIEKSKDIIQKAIIEANSNVHEMWLSSYKKVLRISNNLDKNLKYQTDRCLQRSKFQYYTNLHFRSMIAADIVYKEYEAINRNFKEINALIVDIAKGKRHSNMNKNQIYEAKDSLKSLNKVYLNHVHSLNHQTEILRDKIGAECGERGEIWLSKMLAKKAKRMENSK